MGTERNAKRERQAQRTILEKRTIGHINDDMQKLASTASNMANRIENLSQRHDGLVRRCAEAAATTDRRLDVLDTWHGVAQPWLDGLHNNVRDLDEVRNRGFWGRVKWLLTGK